MATSKPCKHCGRAACIKVNFFESALSFNNPGNRFKICSAVAELFVTPRPELVAWGKHVFAYDAKRSGLDECSSVTWFFVCGEVELRQSVNLIGETWHATTVNVSWEAMVEGVADWGGDETVGRGDGAHEALLDLQERYLAATRWVNAARAVFDGEIPLGNPGHRADGL